MIDCSWGVPWDGESWCVVDGCRMPAFHDRPVGMVGEDLVTETVCCGHWAEPH